MPSDKIGGLSGAQSLADFRKSYLEKHKGADQVDEDDDLFDPPSSEAAAQAFGHSVSLQSVDAPALPQSNPLSAKSSHESVSSESMEAKDDDVIELMRPPMSPAAPRKYALFPDVPDNVRARSGFNPSGLQASVNENVVRNPRLDGPPHGPSPGPLIVSLSQRGQPIRFESIQRRLEIRQKEGGHQKHIQDAIAYFRKEGVQFTRGNYINLREMDRGELGRLLTVRQGDVQSAEERQALRKILILVAAQDGGSAAVAVKQKLLPEIKNETIVASKILPTMYGKYYEGGSEAPKDSRKIDNFEFGSPFSQEVDLNKIDFAIEDWKEMSKIDWLP